MTQQYGLSGGKKTLSTPLKYALRAGIFVAYFAYLLFFGASFVAYKYGNAALLGEPVYWRIYSPLAYRQWKNDYPQHAENMKAQMLAGAALGSLPVGILMIFLHRYRRRLDATKLTDVHGSARWAEKNDIIKAGLLHKEIHPDNDYVICGGWKDKRKQVHYLLHRTPEHILVYAPTRSGKGVSIVVPTLLSWGKSSVVLDVKGELYELTSGYRKAIGQKILKFEPAAAKSNSCYNPLAEIRKGTDDEMTDVTNLAKELINPGSKDITKDYFLTAGRDLLIGLILHIIYVKDDASIADLAQLLGQHDDKKELMRDIKDTAHLPNGQAHPNVVEIMNNNIEKADQELSGVVSSVTNALTLFSNVIVGRNTSRSTFRLADLMNHSSPVTLYIVISPTDMDTMRPLVRIMLTQILTISLKEGISKYRHRLLMLLDEFPAIGRIDLLANAIAYVAGYGIKMMVVTQNLGQLKHVYGQHQPITANCHVQIAFAPNENETAKLLSDTLGETTVVSQEISLSGKKAGSLSNASLSIRREKRPLLTQAEVTSLPGIVLKDGVAVEGGDMLIKVAGAPPIYGKQILYFLDTTMKQRTEMQPATCDDLTGGDAAGGGRGQQQQEDAELEKIAQQIIDRDEEDAKELKIQLVKF